MSAAIEADADARDAKLDQLDDDGAFRVWQSRILYRTHLNNRKKRVEMATGPERLWTHV